METRRMKDSFIKSYYPFSSSTPLREEYMDAYGGIRIGKIIEDMDALAGLIAYKHYIPVIGKTLQPLVKDGLIFCPRNILSLLTRSFEESTHKDLVTIVTASVDRIHFLRPLQIHFDVSISGFVSYVGKSSMEVVFRLESKDNPHDTTTCNLVAFACFTMVARDSKTYTAVLVPPLELISSEESLSFSETEKRRALRKASVTNSLLHSPPLSLESLHIHELFVKSQSVSNDKSNTLVESNALLEHYTWMDETIISSTKICHPQEKNIHNFMFGGALMREAYEIAFATASKYFKGSPICFSSMGDTSFKLPIPIGSILLLTSQVIYYEKFKGIKNPSSLANGGGKLHDVSSDFGMCQVSVKVDILNNTNGMRTNTSVFHFNFESQAYSESLLLPKTYSEMMVYLEGQRRLHFILAEDPILFKNWDVWIEKILS